MNTNSVRLPLAGLLTAILLSGASGVANAADWPMWRFDACRSAASPEELPENLKLQWTLQLPRREQVWDDPLNHDLMPYDRLFEPIVMGGRMFLTFNDTDKVVAYDVRDGRELWRFYTDGPVRLPPVGANGKVYATSDDGHLYCLDAASGKLAWKFRGSPSAQKALGNKRLVSVWPARGGPVIRNGTIYFAASIWPFMGTFIHALDAETGKVQWVNDSTGAQYIKQPHSAPSFAGVAPQGALVATSDYLLVPGGRSVPAAFDRKTGEFKHFEINAGGKGVGGSLVLANESEFFVHTRHRGVRSFALATGKKGSFTCNEPVLTDEFIYASGMGKDGQPGIQAFTPAKKLAWEFAADGSGDLLKAGNRLYAAGANSIQAIDLPTESQPAQLAWSLPVPGEVQRLLAANGRLFAVTLDGRIMAFGPTQATQPVAQRRIPFTTPPEPIRAQAREWIKRADARAGYCLWFGVDDVVMLDAMLAESELHIVVVDSDAARIGQLRRRFDEAGLYGNRVVLHQGSPSDFKAPPYIAHLVVAGATVLVSTPGEQTLKAMYDSVRPYGGAMILAAGAKELTALKKRVEAAGLEKAKVIQRPHAVVAVRDGALPQAADWTHQYGDIANSVKSDDSRLKLPLGVLWFGGPSNMDVLPRHGHGPPEQVIGGRMFIEGMNSLSARDVYTGRILWKREFEDLGTFGIYYNETYKDTPLDPAYNQKHIPGANGRGANYAVAEDAVYLAIHDNCHVLDPRSGATRMTIRLDRKDGQKETPQWGFIGVYENVLLAGNGFANFSRKNAAPGEKIKPGIEDYSASDGLIGYDRHTGRKLWSVPAQFSFLHNGIVAGNGRVHCLDKLPKSAEDKLKRRGAGTPKSYRIVTLDSHTGSILWEQTTDIFGTWLGYSVKHDVLLQAGAKASDRLRDEISQGMITYRGKDGKVLWQRPDLKYSGPCILHNEWIIANADQHSDRKGVTGGSTVFSLLDGSDLQITNPITGTREPWRIARGKGCNSIIACENFLTFRDGAASYYDLADRNGIGSFGGFKSGCTANLVVANGVLNAPDYTRTCSCSYQNQTSLALVHMPDVELWTSSLVGHAVALGDSIQRLGINLGAPGDRLSEQGTLWVDYPSVGGASPAVSIELKGSELKYFRQHTSKMAGSPLPWVMASGVENVDSIVINPHGLSNSSAETVNALESIRAQAQFDTAEESSDGKVTIRSSDLEMTQEKSLQVVGIRFQKLNLKRGEPAGAIRIRFTVDEPGAAPCELTIRAEATDNAAAFYEKNRDISSRRLTQASVKWNPPAWKKSGQSESAQTTPDLSPLVREVINRKNWKPGNAIAFIITGSGKRVAAARGNSAPNLMIEAGKPPVAGSPSAPQPATKRYTLRLYFAEPGGARIGDRIFDLSLQGKPVMRNVDILGLANAGERAMTREFRGIPVSDEFKIDLKRSPSAHLGPVLSGIELLAE